MKLLGILFLLLAGCTSQPFEIGVSDGYEHDNRPVSIDGALVVGTIPGYNHFYICRAGHVGEADPACIDVTAKSRLESKLREIPRDCVTLVGVFHRYGPDILKTGYLRSHIGRIDAQRVSVCEVRANNSFKPTPLRGAA